MPTDDLRFGRQTAAMAHCPAELAPERYAGSSADDISDHLSVPNGSQPSAPRGPFCARHPPAGERNAQQMNPRLHNNAYASAFQLNLHDLYKFSELIPSVRYS